MRRLFLLDARLGEGVGDWQGGDEDEDEGEDEEEVEGVEGSDERGADWNKYFSIKSRVDQEIYLSKNS